MIKNQKQLKDVAPTSPKRELKPVFFYTHQTAFFESEIHWPEVTKFSNRKLKLPPLRSWWNSCPEIIFWNSRKMPLFCQLPWSHIDIPRFMPADHGLCIDSRRKPWSAGNKQPANENLVDCLFSFAFRQILVESLKLIEKDSILSCILSKTIWLIIWVMDYEIFSGS